MFLSKITPEQLFTGSIQGEPRADEYRVGAATHGPGGGGVADANTGTHCPLCAYRSTINSWIDNSVKHRTKERCKAGTCFTCCQFLPARTVVLPALLLTLLKPRARLMQE